MCSPKSFVQVDVLFKVTKKLILWLLLFHPCLTCHKALSWNSTRDPLADLICMTLPVIKAPPLFLLT